MTATILPPVHAPHVGGDPATALAELRAAIEHEITNQPRSLQTAIGPSEIGTPCTHCLAAKMAGWAKTDDGIPWLPWVGTAMHSQLEELFIRSENERTGGNHTTSRRYLAEQPVMVGHIGNQEVWGSTDLVDLQVGMTVDWKLVGANTLRTARRGPSEVYRTQADLYAKGWNDAGHRIDHVAIAYLPRNAMSLGEAIWWTAPHDRDRAETALARANHLHTQLQALTSVSIEARDAWITGLDRDPDCFDCARYAQDRPRSEALDGLLTP